MNDRSQVSQAQPASPARQWPVSWRLLPLSVSGLCLVAVAIALVSQYQFGMQPCPWCTLQRLLFLLIALVAGACTFAAGSLLGRMAAGVALLLSAAGAVSALWQHLVASKSGSCALTLADRILDGLGLFRLLPSVFEPKASCTEAAVDLLGMPYELWSLSLFILCGAVFLFFLLKAPASQPLP